MNRRWLSVLLLLSVGMNVGILATMALRHRQATARAEAPAPRNLDAVADRLELEGETRERFLALHRTFFREMGENRKRATLSQRALRAELVRREPDRAEVDRLHSERSRLMVEVMFDSRDLLDGRQERLYLVFFNRLTTRLGRGMPPARFQ